MDETKQVDDPLDEHLARHHLDARRIFLWGEIDEKTTKEVTERIRYLCDLASSPIFLHICSIGGDVDCSIAIIDEILGARSHKVEINTIATGVAYSAAANVLAVGTPGRRWATQNSTIMLHPASFDLEKDYGPQQQSATEFYNRHSDIINSLVAKACRKRYIKKFKDMIDKGLWMTAKEAVRFGIIDGIWDYRRQKRK